MPFPKRSMQRLPRERRHECAAVAAGGADAELGHTQSILEPGHWVGTVRGPASSGCFAQRSVGHGMSRWMIFFP